MEHRVTPFLWYDSQAEEAAEFYVSLFPNSRITGVSRYPDGGPMPAGQAMVVEFELDGLPVNAMNAGPVFSFTEAFSFSVRADTQEEIDRLWDGLIADGGSPSQCGWLKDRWGLSWQIVPGILMELQNDPDRERAGRAMRCMMGQTKLIIADLVAAADGD